MNYHKIEQNSMLNGEGLRTVLWCAGCNHKCKECHNPETWNPNGGTIFDEAAMKEVLESLAPSWVSGLTLSGGDPLFPANREKETEIAKTVKTMYPEKTIWLYTGYEFDEIKDLEVLNYVDVVVSGPFEIAKKDDNFEWAGSTNQQVMQKNPDKTWSDVSKTSQVI